MTNTDRLVRLKKLKQKLEIAYKQGSVTKKMYDESMYKIQMEVDNIVAMIKSGQSEYLEGLKNEVEDRDERVQAWRDSKAKSVARKQKHLQEVEQRRKERQRRERASSHSHQLIMYSMMIVGVATLIGICIYFALTISPY